MCESCNNFVNKVLVKGYNDGQLLDVCFDHSLADERGTEKRPEGHQKMAACDSGQVKKRIWDLFLCVSKKNEKHFSLRRRTTNYDSLVYRCTGKNSEETDFLD